MAALDQPAKDAQGRARATVLGVRRVGQRERQTCRWEAGLQLEGLGLADERTVAVGEAGRLVAPDETAEPKASPQAAESESSDKATAQDEPTTGESGDHDSGGSDSESGHSGSDEHDGGD